MKVTKPNVRKILLPEPDYTIFEIDQAQADARIVAWDADDTELMNMFETPGLDMHVENAMKIFKLPRDKIRMDGSPTSHRQRAKVGVHAANYKVSAVTLAQHLNISVAAAKEFLHVWYSLHPKIPRWHQNISFQLQTKREVRNVYGARIHYFDRLESIFTEALAWIPQSTVAINTMEMMNRIDAIDKDVIILLNGHDSVIGEAPTEYFKDEEFLRTLRKAATITVPYKRPLVMPCDLKTSTISWGLCQKKSWPKELPKAA